jgi:hypothetical protein
MKNQLYYWHRVNMLDIHMVGRLTLEHLDDELLVDYCRWALL